MLPDCIDVTVEHTFLQPVTDGIFVNQHCIQLLIIGFQLQEYDNSINRHAIIRIQHVCI